MTAPLDPLVKLGRDNERLKIRNAELTAINRKLSRRFGGFALDEAVEELREFLKVEQAEPFIIKPAAYRIPKNLGAVPFDKGHKETAASMWSDWHFSEVVRLEDTNGANKYNSMIAANRVWALVDKTKRILTGHMAMYTLEGLWLLILGDMINGSIHDELKYTNDLSDIDAAILAARIIIMAIIEIKELGLPINIDCIVGNHPRLTIKMPLKRQAAQSLDYLIYEMVANKFNGDDQVQITVHSGVIGMRQVYDWRYLFLHGIGVRSGKEDDFEDNMRGLFDDGAYRRATGLKGTTFDMICMGNLHVPRWLARVLVNGSLTGQNELGVGWYLKMIKAQQFLWGISPNHVTTWQYPIDLSDIRSDRPDNGIAEYTAWFIKKNRR